MEDDKIERLRERILQCPICMDEYKDPRILTCHHTVCLQCLLDYVQHTSTSGRIFRCPQCRADVCVPRGGVKDFPPNFYVNCIQDELGAKAYFGICDACERDWLVSQYRCVDCDLDLCRFCIHDHRLHKHDPGRSVNIMRIETGNLGMNLTAQKNCEDHTDESLQMFCCTCNKPVCVTCVCETHKKHETMPLVKKFSHAQKLLQFELDQLKTVSRSVTNSNEEIQKLENRVKQTTEAAIHGIQAQTQELVLKMNKSSDSKIEDLRTMEKSCLQDIESYKKELNSLMSHIEQGSQFLEDLQEGDISLELLDTYERYRTRLDLIRKSVSNKVILYQESTFFPGKSHQFMDIHLMKFGRLKREKKNVIFMPNTVDKSQIPYLNRFHNHVTLCNFFKFIFVTLILLSIVHLSYGIYYDPNRHIGQGIGLLFFLYLSGAGFFAYLKS